MEARVAEPMSFPGTNMDTTSMARNGHHHKRKRDSIDGETSERSTQRQNISQYPPFPDMIHTNEQSVPTNSGYHQGPYDDPNFFDLGPSTQPNDAKAVHSKEQPIAEQNTEAPAVGSAPQPHSYGAELPPAPMDNYPEPPAPVTSKLDARQPEGASTANMTENSIVDDSAVDAEGVLLRSPNSGKSRLTVGSDEWHKQRKDNHKEVERRRRETINEGINALAQLLPNSNEKNKGSILQNAVNMIRQLQDENARAIKNWTLEKVLVDQAVRELEARLNRMYRTAEAWKKVAQDHGVNVDEVDLRIEPLPAKVDLNAKVQGQEGGAGVDGSVGAMGNVDAHAPGNVSAVAASVAGNEQQSHVESGHVEQARGAQMIGVGEPLH